MELPNTQNKGEATEKKSFWEQSWGTVRRGVVGSMAAVLFGTVILMASIFAAANPVKVKPFEVNETAKEKTAAVMVEKVNDLVASDSGMSKKIEYYLPYPGMLPDNRLYFVKALRDRLKLMATFSEEEKIALKLLYADKRINAAIYLQDGGKEQLAVSTATKAEKYLQQAVDSAVGMSKEKDVKSLLLSLANATAKHYEILSEMQTKASGDYQDVLSKTKEMTLVNSQKVSQALIEGL